MGKLLTAALIGLGVTAGAGGALADGQLHIYNFGNYTSPEMVSKFEKTYNVKVSVDSYDSNDQMLAKVKAGGSGYDIVVPSSFIVPAMIEDGLLAKVEPNQMPNFKNMRPEFVNVYWDEGRHYSVPWLWGTTGVTVNTDAYKGDVNTWGIVFDTPAELKGKVNALPEMTDVITAASFYLGQKTCSADKADLKKINDLLMKAKTDWRAMEYSTIENLTAKNFLASMDYNGSALKAKRQLASLKYGYPKEGMASWMDNMVILKESKNSENAKLFLNFIMDPENAALMSAFSGYDNAIQGSEKFFPKDMVNAPELTPPQGFKYNFVPACPQKVAEIYAKIWNNLMK
ncbi:MAG: extracellular solute-binding protein [Rhodospirillaceae bacterium]|nr:MAG: extracellular solute-binding protein [Rhodospirillaceae bacterium]